MVLTRTALLLIAVAALLACSSGPGAPSFGPAHQLAFSPQPGGGVAGQPMPVRVEVRDAQGRLVTNSTAPVLLRLYLSPADLLTGTTSVNAVAGVASFTDLAISKADYPYSLIASSGALLPAHSNAFAISAPPTR